MAFKKLVGRIHLWLGMASGLIVLMLGVTGCLFVFHQEIETIIYADKYFVEKGAITLPMSQLWQIAETELGPDKPIFRGAAYQHPDNHSWVFSSYVEGSQDALTYFDAVKVYEEIYIDPYTGRVLDSKDYKKDFFNVVKMLHWSLLLNTDIGQPIIGWSTFTFVIMLISGMILWWPKNKKARKQRFNVKWNARWRRFNYDLHNVLGFYFWSVLLVLALTGMVWAFQWFQTTVYVVASQSITPPIQPEAKSNPSDSLTEVSAMDIAFLESKKLYPEASAFGISPARSDSAVLSIYVQHIPGAYYKSSTLQFDQYTGELLSKKDHNDKNMGEKVITANYDIHVGAILGLPGKILAFCGSLIAASLPVTGFMIWWGRRKKTKLGEKPITRHVSHA